MGFPVSTGIRVPARTFGKAQTSTAHAVEEWTPCAQYTKSDWVLWSACMSPDDATFQKFIDPIYTYANETTSRVPISDWHDTNTGKMMNFKARSVVGGYYMKLLMEKVKEQK